MNHVLKHSKNEEIPVSHFGNQQACTDHSHDNNSRGKNPSRYHNPVGKSIWHILTDLTPYTPEEFLESHPVNKEKVLTISQALNLLKQRGYLIKNDPSPVS